MSKGANRRTLGRYELLEHLGRGSAFDAYKAKSFGVEGFEKTVVVKQVLPHLEKDWEFMNAFIRSAQRVVRLSHANVVQVFDLGQGDEEERAYMATEHVAGLDLDTLLARFQHAEQKPPLSLCLYIGAEIAKALDHAHRRRDEQLRSLDIVHGAVGAHNVLLSWEGDVKLADFCVGSALRASKTPVEADMHRLDAALSPEQAEGRTPTAASDLFGLGALLYRAIAGEHPFATETREQTLERVRRAGTPPLRERRRDVPPPVADLIGRLMSLDPAERGSAAQVHEELLGLLYSTFEPFSGPELSAVIERYRAPSPSISDAIDRMLKRPVTWRPETQAEQRGDRASLPPLAAFAETRHVAALVLSFAQKSPLQKPQRERAIAVLGRYGGHLVEEKPREVTALFGADSNDGHAVETAVRCALVLLRTVMVGAAKPVVAVETGRIRVDNDTPVSAAAFGLLADARDLSKKGERVVLVGPRAARGLRVHYRLEPSDGSFVVQPRSQQGGLERFVGRRPELQHLAEVLARSSKGKLQVVGIVGDLGIGKSRLLREMARRLSRGSLDLESFIARCPPRGTTLPLSGIAAMLRRLCGVQEGDPADRVTQVEPRLRALGLSADEVGAVLEQLGAAKEAEQAASSAVLSAAVARMLQRVSEERFHVFAWDDAQELDQASVELIGRVRARLRSSAITLIFAARSDASGPYEELRFDTELRLGELDEFDTERLVALRAGLEPAPPELTDFVVERAGGHPMYIEALVRELLSSGALVVEDGVLKHFAPPSELSPPATLRALMAGRIRELAQTERDVFVAAAVLDAPVSIQVVAAMLELPVSAVEKSIDALDAAGLVVRDEPEAVGFPSPLLREVVLSELDETALSDMHRMAADAYQKVLGNGLEEEAERIGYHLAAAGQPDRAADFYATSGLHHLAVRHLWRAALDLGYALDLADFSSRGGPQIGNWVRAMSNAVRQIRAGATLGGLVDRVIERIQLEPPREARLRVQVRIDAALMVGALDRYTEAVALLESVMAEAERWSDVARSLFIARGELALQKGEVTRALGALGQARRFPAGDSLEQHRLMVALAEASGATGKHVQAVSALQQAERVASPHDLVLGCERERVSAICLGFQGQWRACAETALQAAVQAEELGLLHHVCANLLAQGRSLLRLGELPRAQAALDSAATTAEELGSERWLLHAQLLREYASALASRPIDSAPLLQLLEAVEKRDWPWVSAEGRYLFATLLAKKGDHEEARRQLSETAERASGYGLQSIADDCHAELAGLKL